MIFLSLGLSGLIVVNNITHFFFDVLNDFDFCICGEAITSLIQDLLEVLGDVITSQMNSLNGMRYGVTLVDWDGM